MSEQTPGIEQVWKREPLSTICSRLTDGSHLSPAPQPAGPAIANVKDLRNGHVDLGSCTRISEADFRKLQSGGCGVNPGDVLLSKDGTIGKVVVYEQPESITALSSICIMRPRHGVDRRFLGQALRSSDFQQQIENATSGSALKRLVLSNIQNLEVPVPPLPEQQCIGKILDTIDTVIEQTEAIIAKQQRIKTGLLQDLLTRGIDEHGNIRSEETHEFKNSPLGRIPIKWDASPLGTLVKEPITYGIVQAGPHVEGGVPYIRTGDMSGDTLPLPRLLRTTKAIAKSYRRSEVHFGDIVFALRATVGKVLPIPKEIDGANLTQGTAKISPGSSVRTDFLLWFMRTPAVGTQLMLVQKGTTFTEITLGDLRTILIAFPRNNHEQKRIADILNSQQAAIAAEQCQGEKLIRLKAGLMQDLLSGKVRVTKLVDQGAKAR
ncbi:restriction endonuclease subunit S [Acidobacteria bacterium AH-259-O06]|nr:restriction endonuclease subunit S [Acidobacteria bacterium AH-259-O06]